MSEGTHVQSWRTELWNANRKDMCKCKCKFGPVWTEFTPTHMRTSVNLRVSLGVQTLCKQLKLAKKSFVHSYKIGISPAIYRAQNPKVPKKSLKKSQRSLGPLKNKVKIDYFLDFSDFFSELSYGLRDPNTKV